MTIQIGIVLDEGSFLDCRNNKNSNQYDRDERKEKRIPTGVCSILVPIAGVFSADRMEALRKEAAGIAISRNCWAGVTHSVHLRNCNDATIQYVPMHQWNMVVFTAG